MKIYYFDHSHKLDLPSKFNAFQNINDVDKNSVIFVHEDGQQKDFVQYATDRDDIHIIFISRSPMGLQKENGWPKNVSVCQKWGADTFKKNWEKIKEKYGINEEK